MRPLPVPQVDPGKQRRSDARAGIRTLFVAGLCLCVGLGLGALWHSRRAQRTAVNAAGEAPGQDVGTLSAGTRAVLQSLKEPVQIRFYALLDAATVPEDVTRFAGRVEELLASYQRESGGKLTVTRLRSRSDVSAAAADGMKPFNLDKGDVCYLGMTVVQGGRKESIPRFFPEWEQAIESDLSRAIGRVLGPSASVASTAATLPVDPGTLAEVKRQLPNFVSVSLEEGSRILREAALKDLQAALSQTEGQIKRAEQQVVRMEEARSETGKQEALKNLQRLQAEQAAKLREFTTRSSAQIEVLRQIKESAR
jgi:ABC-type uncharacterized transport system involved in gliding motility auxiliary subunit